MRSSPWQIPKSWQWSTMGDVADVVGGGTPPTHRIDYFEGDIPWITPADLTGFTEKFISRGSRSLSQEGFDNSAARLLPAGTVLFSSRAPIGHVAIAASPMATSQGFKSFVLPEGLIPEYVYYYLQRARKLAVELASGTTFPELSAKRAARIPIPIPPTEEQQLIVGEVEKQFTRLEAANAAMKRLLANLNRYRLSIIKVACEGRLLGTMEAKSIERRETWKKIPLIDVCDSISDGDHQAPPKQPAGIPFLTIGNISSGKIDFSNTRFVSENYFSRLKPERIPLRGDVLYTVVGTIGIPVLVSTERDFCFQRHIALLKPSKAILPKFLWLILSNPNTIRKAWEMATGSAQLTLSLTALRGLLVSVPSLQVQSDILSEVERRLSVVGEIEAVIKTNAQRAIQLRQSILQRAFRGDLTRQDPNNRPVIQLMKEIKEAGKTPRASGKPKRRSKHKMQNKSAETLTDLLERLDAIGASAEPERLLNDTGLGDDIDKFFELLREGHKSGSIIVPIGATGVIKRNKNAN